MNGPLRRLTAVLLFTSLVSSHAEQPAKQDEATKLITRVYPVSEGMLRLDSGGELGLNKPSSSGLRALRPAADGESRYDAWSCLAANGVDRKPPGSEAIFLANSHALVVTTSGEIQEIVERIVDMSICGYRPKHVEITATLWEYEDDQFADADAKPSHLSELRKRVGDSLKLLDSQMIATKSGQRAVRLVKECDENRAPVALPAPNPANPPANEAAPSPSLNGSRGSHLEVEPAIGPDGEQVDMQIWYEARLSRPNAEQDMEVNVSTNLTVMNGQDAIASRSLAREVDAPTRGGKVKRNTLIIGARVVDSDGRTAAEHKKLQEQKEEELIRKARAGLGVPK